MGRFSPGWITYGSAKLLLLFKIHTKTDTGMQYHECAYVSVLEEYKGPRKSGHIVHILHINSKYDEQNRALLDTLRIHRSSNTPGHIVLYSTLLIGHTQHAGQMRVSSCPFVPRKFQQSNRQDMVFIRPPGISDCAFQLRMDNIWFCKLLLLFKIHTKTDTSMQCWKSTRAHGNQVILCIFYILCIF